MIANLRLGKVKGGFSKVDLGFQNFVYDFGGVGGDFNGTSYLYLFYRHFLYIGLFSHIWEAFPLFATIYLLMRKVKNNLTPV